jgi:TRAP transporter TAXI family solute receptor
MNLAPRDDIEDTAMEHTTSESNVGSAIPLRTVIAALVACAVIVGGFLIYRLVSEGDQQRDIVIATGPEGGTYHTLGTALAKVLESEGIVHSATPLPTEGSVSNMDLIGDGTKEVQFAIVQSDTPAHDDALLVAHLYDEVLHLLVATRLAGEIATVHDLEGHRAAIGARGSGTRQVAMRVLDHFRVGVGEALEISPRAAVDGLVEGTVDAVFLLTAVPSPAVDELCRRNAVRFLSLGDAQEAGNEAEGVALVNPSLHGTVIPRQTYGVLPERPVSSIGVTAQLVASSRADGDLVRDVTDALFRYRSQLVVGGGELAVAKRIRERYRPGSTIVPYHHGAVAYYERSQPPFLVEYAEAISLGLTLLVGLYSGSIALREWMRRRKKNRIDGYYVETVELTADLSHASVESLNKTHDALVGLRQKAFADLVAEKLDPNESFTILQDHINSELATIESLLESRSRPR